jgi:rod shape-determining protein MreD
MGKYIALPLLVLAATLQATLTPQISILGGRPDLVFLIVLAWAANAPLEDSVLLAFIGGIALDLLSTTPLGASVIGILLAVFVMYGWQQQMYRVGFISLIWFVLIGTLVNHSIELVIMLFSGFRPAFASRLGYGILLDNITYVILPTVFYNLLLVLPIYWLVRRIQRRVYDMATP